MVTLTNLYDGFPDVLLARESLDEVRTKSISARFDPKVNDDNYDLVKTKMFNDEFWKKFTMSTCIYFVEVNGEIAGSCFNLKDALDLYNGVL